MPQRIEIKTLADRWRWTCPRGHANWYVTDARFYCQSCARQRGVDPEFAALRDQRTGELLDREHVVFDVADSRAQKRLNVRGSL